MGIRGRRERENGGRERERDPPKTPAPSSGKYVLPRRWRENLISESTFAVAAVHCVHYARLTRSSSLLDGTRSDPVQVSTDARHSSLLRCPVSFLLPTIFRSRYLESSIRRFCHRAFRGLASARRNAFFFDGNSFIVSNKYRADGRYWLEVTESSRYSRYRWCVHNLPYLKKGNCCVSCNSITGDLLEMLLIFLRILLDVSKKTLEHNYSSVA